MESLNFSTPNCPNTHYRKIGAGCAVVLLHGFPEDGSLWENILPALSSSNKVIVPDIPGCGKSEPLVIPDSMESLADAIFEILQRERINEVVMVGHSMGGYITMAFAEKYGEYLKGISLVHSTATKDSEEKKEIRRRSIEIIEKGGKEAFVKGMIPNLFSTHYKEAHDEVIQRQMTRGLKLSGSRMISFYNAMINRPARTSILTKANYPVQWIVGREDTVVPFDTAMSQTNLSNINFVSVYNECAHMSMIEKPDNLSNDLCDFIYYCYNR